MTPLFGRPGSALPCKHPEHMKAQGRCCDEVVNPPWTWHDFALVLIGVGVLVGLATGVI